MFWVKRKLFGSRSYKHVIEDEIVLVWSVKAGFITGALPVKLNLLQFLILI